MSREKDYEIGYGRPPKHAQFRKGKSGNPKGRPKGSRNFATDLDTVLSAPVTITVNGAPKRVSTQMAALMRLREKGLNGDARLLDRLLSLAADRSAEKEARSAERSLSNDETEILDRFAAEILRGAGHGPDATPKKGDDHA